MPSNPAASEFVETARSSRAGGRALRFCFFPSAESNTSSISSPPFRLRLEESLDVASTLGCSEGPSGAKTETDSVWPLVEGTEIAPFDDCWALQASGSLFSNSRFIFRTKYFPYCDPARFCSWEDSDFAIFSCSGGVVSRLTLGPSFDNLP